MVLAPKERVCYTHSEGKEEGREERRGGLLNKWDQDHFPTWLPGEEEEESEGGRGEGDRDFGRMVAASSSFPKSCRQGRQNGRERGGHAIKKGGSGKKKKKKKEPGGTSEVETQPSLHVRREGKNDLRDGCEMCFVC